jgi:hypothetical protein
MTMKATTMQDAEFASVVGSLYDGDDSTNASYHAEDDVGGNIGREMATSIGVERWSIVVEIEVKAEAARGRERQAGRHAFNTSWSLMANSCAVAGFAELGALESFSKDLEEATPGIAIGWAAI